MTQPALVVEDYSFWYKGLGGARTLALEHVSFEVTKGEFVLILGPSGSGKSTLALNLVGIYPDFFGGWNDGRILVDIPGRGLVNRRELDRGTRFKTVNMLFQNPEDQIVTLTVEEELGFALENYLVPVTEIPARIDRALELVGLEGFRARSTTKLSGGEKQRVALASMLAMEPRVLILDEPTSNLDPQGSEEVLTAIGRVRDRLDITMLIVEHEVDEVFHQVDRAILVDGKNVSGPYQPREFLAQHGLDVRDRMGLWIPQATEIALKLAREGMELASLPLTGPELVTEVRAARDGRPSSPAVTSPRPDQLDPPDQPAPTSPDLVTPRTRGETVIEVREVHFSYPTKPDVLCGVTFDVRRGELLAIVGQNGSGKSTVAAQLNGLLRPSRGEVLVDGRPTTRYKFAELAKRVAYIFQVPEKQFIRTTVTDEMSHGLKALRLPEEEIAERVERFLADVNLTERADASPYVLSHGQKRRLSVACMVIADPEVVVLDEPTFGQDHRQAQRLMQLLRGLASRGAAVAFITHDMRLVAEHADRCVALTGGRTIFDGTPMELFSSPDVLRRARLKTPPIFDASRELFGEPILDADDAGARIKELLSGQFRTVL